MAKAFTVGLLAGGAMYWSLSSNLWETRQQAAKQIAEVHAGVPNASRLNERPLVRATDVMAQTGQVVRRTWNSWVLQAHDTVSAKLTRS
mmetsp:Transcript_8107/g.25457  ORF Transcript_8107/g.25457 Transcript_8107/m.25457 type:complete len:89 (+) Transcript_8107:2-268(+)